MDEWENKQKEERNGKCRRLDESWLEGGQAHLLRLVDEDEERPIRLAEAETEEDGGTLEDLRGEMEPWPAAAACTRL